MPLCDITKGDFLDYESLEKGGNKQRMGFFSFLGSWQVVDVVKGVSAAYKPFNNRAEAC